MGEPRGEPGGGVVAAAGEWIVALPAHWDRGVLMYTQAQSKMSEDSETKIEKF